jgi:hypothetical protein
MDGGLSEGFWKLIIQCRNDHAADWIRDFPFQVPNGDAPISPDGWWM